MAWPCGTQNSPIDHLLVYSSIHVHAASTLKSAFADIIISSLGRFVRFESEEEAKHAIETLDGWPVHGFTIRVERAKGMWFQDSILTLMNGPPTGTLADLKETKVFPQRPFPLWRHIWAAFLRRNCEQKFWTVWKFYPAGEAESAPAAAVPHRTVGGQPAYQKPMTHDKRKLDALKDALTVWDNTCNNGKSLPRLHRLSHWTSCWVMLCRLHW